MQPKVTSMKRREKTSEFAKPCDGNLDENGNSDNRKTLKKTKSKRNLIQTACSLCFGLLMVTLALDQAPEWQTRVSRSSPPMESFNLNDPLLPVQWHLENTGSIRPEWKGNDINVSPVWEMGINGSGVTVAIIDDGVDFHHADLSENWSPEGSWDFTRRSNRPLPAGLEDVHGTRCAGQIAASANNSICGVGVAFGAKIAAERINPNATTDALEATAFSYKNQINHIYSSSWGPEDNGATVDGPGKITQKAFANGVKQGRGGRGSIYVFASGNGGTMGDNCNFDGYANSPFTISIGAISIDGRIPNYGEQCAAHLAVTYSGDSRNMISTTDVGGKCTQRHSGTSAAAPIAAGMIALMLSARPDLTWRDIQYVIIQNAKVTDGNDSDWSINGAGLMVNHKYGFGNMDAHALVLASQTHKHVPHEALIAEKEATVYTKIPMNAAMFEHIINISEEEAGQISELEHVSVTIRLKHYERRFVTIKLISPQGTVSVLATERVHDLSTDGFMPWTFVTVRNWGESPVGKWTLQIMDARDVGQEGTLLSWKLGLRGVCQSSNQVSDPLNGLPICTMSLTMNEARVRMYWMGAAIGSSVVLLAIAAVLFSRLHPSKLEVQIPKDGWSSMSDMESATPTPLLPPLSRSASSTFAMLPQWSVSSGDLFPGRTGGWSDRLMALLPQQPSFYDKLESSPTSTMSSEFLSPASESLSPAVRTSWTDVSTRKSSDASRTISVPTLHVTNADS
jgi:subtilisin-like proprotein convertase family protein